MRGERNTDKNMRKFITIRDEEKWKQIEKLMSLPQYRNTFNKVINDALDYGLPLLIKAEFGELEEEETEQTHLPAHGKDEEFYGQVVRLMKEMIMNSVINKAILSSLFEAKLMELKREPVSATAFERGCFQDLPKFAEVYELRTLKSLRE
ncbi:MAG: hypothetical protein NC548_57745 [Lachnospiraceae bacterium]|nr:hypothetical protein [Lachnospiraceae bacterium]